MKSKLALILLAAAVFLAACEPGAVLTTSTPFIIGGRLVTATPSPTTQPTPTVSPTPENIPDLSGSSIPLILLCDSSGVFAAGNAARVAGVEDAVAALNTSGGIFGAQLDLHVADTEGTVEGAQRAEARLLRQFEAAPLLILCDPQAEGALAETLNEDGIPALTAGAFATADGELFGLGATPDEQLAFFLGDLSANWLERKPPGADAQIRLAVFSWPAELVGEATTPELLAYAESLGVQIVLQTELDADPEANIFDLIYEARIQNANAIYINMRSFGLAYTLNAISNLGLHDRFVIGAPGAAYDADFYSYLADPAFAQGLYLSSAWAWWSEDNPGVARAEAMLSTNAEWLDWGYLQMAGSVDLAVRAIEDVLLEDGLDGLNAAAVSEALSKLSDHTVLDGLYTADYTAGRRTLQLLRTWQVGVTPGELILLGEYAQVPELSD